MSCCPQFWKHPWLTCAFEMPDYQCQGRGTWARGQNSVDGGVSYRGGSPATLSHESSQSCASAVGNLDLQTQRFPQTFNIPGQKTELVKPMITFNPFLAFLRGSGVAWHHNYMAQQICWLRSPSDPGGKGKLGHLASKRKETEGPWRNLKDLLVCNLYIYM